MASKEFSSEKAFEAKPDSDVETLEHTKDDGTPKEMKLVRQLKNRHIAMIRCAAPLFLLSLARSLFGSVLAGSLGLVCLLAKRANPTD